MNHISNRQIDHILAVVGLLVALPAICFFTGSFLKYEMNLLSGVEIFVPPPVVMIGGLLLALSLNFFALLRVKSTTVQGTFTTRFVKSKSWNVSIIIIAVLFLVLLLSYVLIENLAESTAALIDIPRYGERHV